jgi:excisionase family DNA binding protein
MPDRVLIPVPGVGVLALDREVFTAALAAGAELTTGATLSPAGSIPEPLLDPDQAAEQLNVSARWLEDSARAGIVPHHKLGRFIRFRVSEIAAHSFVEGAPLPRSTDNQSVSPFRRHARQ